MGYIMSGSPHKMGTIIGASAFKQKRVTKTKLPNEGRHATYGDTLYNSDGTISNVIPENTTESKFDEKGEYVTEKGKKERIYFTDPTKSDNPVT